MASSLTWEFTFWLLACMSFTQLIKPWGVLHWSLQYSMFSFGLACSLSQWSHSVPEQIRRSYWTRGEKGKIKKRKWVAIHGYLLDDFTRSRLEQYQTYISFLYPIASVLSKLYLRSQRIYSHFCKPTYCILVPTSSQYIIIGMLTSSSPQLWGKTRLL